MIGWFSEWFKSSVSHQYIMTRINCVSPHILCQQHLVAGYRELPRVFNLVINAVKRGEKPSDKRNPAIYVLGTGHVRFFYPRLGYLLDRQASLIQEMQKRGITTNFSPPSREQFPTIPDSWFGNWIPTEQAIKLSSDRIKEKLPRNPIYHKELYYGIPT